MRACFTSLVLSLLYEQYVAAPLASWFPWEDPLHYWPAAANLTNVKDFGAKGDGVTDDTIALQKAFNATPSNGGRLWFPAGTYLVSSTLTPPAEGPGVVTKRRIYQGQSVSTAIIKLMDSAPGFNNASKPIPVVSIGGGVAQNFGDVFMCLTINVGSNNPGAIALSLDVNNQGGLRNVSLVDPSNGGAAKGLLIPAEPGPMLVKYLAVSGFSRGVEVQAIDASVTFEYLALQTQGQAGLFTVGQTVAIKGLISNNTVPALQLGLGAGYVHVTVVDAYLTSPTVLAGEDLIPGPAINITDTGSEVLFARNVVVHGYEYAIQQWTCRRSTPCVLNSTSVPGPYISTWSLPAQALTLVNDTCTPQAGTLNLTAPDTPIPYEPPAGSEEEWVNLLLGCTPVTGWDGSAQDEAGTAPPAPIDCTESWIQALNTPGATVAYIPAGVHGVFLKGTIVIPNAIQRIVGHITSLEGNATFLIGGPSCKALGAAAAQLPPITFEYMWADYTANMSIALECARTVSVVGVTGIGVVAGPRIKEGGDTGNGAGRAVSYRLLGEEQWGKHGTVGVGDVFLEDACGDGDGNFGSGGLSVLPGQRVWARQLDTESSVYTDVHVQEGGMLWVLGWKTEAGAEGLITTNNSLAVEILGAFNFQNGPVKTGPMYSVLNTPFSSSTAEHAWNGNHPFGTTIYEQYIGSDGQQQLATLANATAHEGVLLMQMGGPLVQRWALYASSMACDAAAGRALCELGLKACGES